MPSDPNGDFLTPTVQALAQIIAANVENLGHVYDQADDDPSPDVVARILADPPDVLFWVTKARFDIRGSTRGAVGRKSDAYTIMATFIMAPYKAGRVTSVQRYARKIPHQMRSVLAGHNTLNGTCWQARTEEATIGPWSDLDGMMWHVVQVPVIVEYEFQVTQAS